ncbi:LacI family transcriptional regulator [Kineosphaera limosa]|uniref:Putative LacI family transcriptional regulator n=1 Tax=Kineosphaera limosa NBRC 100340 TaxID=1184609 RepID=K6XC54_9MICO|nr:LacI family DNA-binding transcriptional regulator [Kineosphaera limosa]NYE00762.1 LacI family transcriptional regulator [Kineosphaera limosa]GAB96374.1 putative LacI family transcriptional regulator [Kineosphaera limosa NBRC 100340]
MSRTHRAATLADVAAEAGVSLATASRAFNGSTRTVGAELAERVFAAAKRLDYAPNAQAQAMVRGRTNTLGLVVHDIADPYFSAIAAGVSRAADTEGMVTLLLTTLGRQEGWARDLTLMRSQRVRAAILVGSMREDPQELEASRAAVRAYEESGGRVVAITQPQLPADTIVVDNHEGARLLATDLAECGYRRFAVLTGPPQLLTAGDRSRGFRDGALAADLPEPVTVAGDFTRDGGYAAMSELLDRIDEQAADIDCVFAANDVMAVGAMAACRARGVRVPHDLALAGFDDIPTLRDHSPALTTVRLPLEQMGEQALRLVLEPAADEPRHPRVSGEVLLRESTPPRRARSG